MPANQRIDDMSFKDLTARAAAAMKPKLPETTKTPAKENEPEISDTEAPAKPKTSWGRASCAGLPQEGCGQPQQLVKGSIKWKI